MRRIELDGLGHVASDGGHAVEPGDEVGGTSSRFVSFSASVAYIGVVDRGDVQASLSELRLERSHLAAPSDTGLPRP